MKTHLLLLLTALALSARSSDATDLATRRTTVCTPSLAADAGKPACPAPAPATPTNPAPSDNKSARKERAPRPARPAYLFM